MKVYIGFSHANNLFSKAIASIEKRPFSHCYIRVKDFLTGKYIVYHASYGLVHSGLFCKFFANTKIIKEFEFDILDSQYRDIHSFLLSKLGAPYSFLQILGILLVKILRISKIPKWARNKDDAEICSELAAKVAHKMGVIINEDFDQITPSRLNDILIKHFKNKQEDKL